jgi:CheY-like chemotaxis protein
MKRILVAEDNDSNYMLMTYILKKHYDFFRALNGQEAVALAESEKPDLILMDMKMPIMDGMEATRQIRAKMPNMPIIALTANAFDSDRQHALEAGCNDFISKPVSAVNCLEIINRYLDEA